MISLRQFALLCITAALLPAVSSCVRSGGSAQSAPPPPQVNVAQVIERRVKDWDEFTGRFQAVESVEIRPRVSGYIDEVAFKEGGQVKRGDLLFVIDPRPYKADADRAAADVKRFKTAHELAQIELTRVQRLKDSGAVSQEELDERKSTVAQAEANVAGAEATLESASLNLNFTRVTSPIAGRVSRAEVTRGNLVTGGLNGGTLLTSVVSIDPIYLYFEGDEQTYLRYIANGAKRRAAQFARRAAIRYASGSRTRKDFPTWAPWTSSTTSSIRRPAPSARAQCSTTRTASSRPDCSRACSCWAAVNTQRS